MPYTTDEFKHALKIGALYAVEALAKDGAGDDPSECIKGAIRNLKKAEELAEARAAVPSAA